MTTRKTSLSTYTLPASSKLSEIIFDHRLFSRVHALRSFLFEKTNCYVKREDELGFGVSGTKARKYLSFVPAVLKQKPDEAIIIGSAYSNHVFSLSQMLVENGIIPILFLLGDEKCRLEGNFLYSTLVAGPKHIHWISRGKWDEVDAIAEDFAKKRALEGKKTLVVPKGANCADSIPGALTLGTDILRNEKEEGIHFDHILIDSGTGLTASALILLFALLGKTTQIHVVQIAGCNEEFERTLSERKKDLEQLLKEPLPSPANYKLYYPSNAAAFGAVNATIFKTISEIANSEGFLTDPVFTAKLFYEGKKIISEQKLQGNILFIHSGGGLGLTGFQKQMAKMIQETCQNRS